MANTDIQVNKKIINRILNDDIKTELVQIVNKELSKPPDEVNSDLVDECIDAINSFNDGDTI